MPRIPDRLLDCVVYLYPSERLAEQGERAGGSGFLVGVEAKRLPDRSAIYVVTNKHVVEGGASVVRLNTQHGDMHTVALDERDWVHHPDGDDLAICQIGLDSNLYKFAWLSLDLILSKEMAERLEIGPGDDVLAIGRFFNHEGRQRNLPSARFGHIAQMPWEPIVYRGFAQESFLVEAHSISGYSGSPVFVQIFPDAPRAAKPVGHDWGVWLLGVDWGHLTYSQEIHGMPHAPKVKLNSGMMAVVPAWKLLELLTSEAVAKSRDELEDAVLKILENRATR